ncbi:MAG: leucyl aminopeptidase [Acidobacteria bacterium]|nr:leucyl aminopeptidase [Acidobacteriota bacterium]
MKLEVLKKQFDQVEGDALVVPMFEGESCEQGLLREVDGGCEGLLSHVLEAEDVRGKLHERAVLFRPRKLKVQRLLVVGAGKRKDFNLERASQIAGTAVRSLCKPRAASLFFYCRPEFDQAALGQKFAEGACLALFDPNAYKTEDKKDKSWERFVLTAPHLMHPELWQQALDRGGIVGRTGNFVRTLVNEPANRLTPTLLADQAKEMAERYGLRCEVLEEHQMREKGMNAILAVGQGSDNPPKLIVLRYDPPDASDSTPVLALVGKGVTFDSGGISIKPAHRMDEMKTDMAGGATVIGALLVAAQWKATIRVLGVVPAVENLPSGHAQRPGDVIRSFSGKTIEVINTDAEGRLILADGLAYAKELGAQSIVDIATLTGACVVALGRLNAGLMGSNQQLVDRILAASRQAGERMWQLPMDDEYKKQLRSEIADLKNTGGRDAGAITAAKFMQEFVGNVPWAHIDIAGVDWAEESEPYLSKGPTGYGLRTLAELIQGF